MVHWTSTYVVEPSSLWLSTAHRISKFIHHTFFHRYLWKCWEIFGYFFYFLVHIWHSLFHTFVSVSTSHTILKNFVILIRPLLVFWNKNFEIFGSCVLQKFLIICNVFLELWYYFDHIIYLVTLSLLPKERGPKLVKDPFSFLFQK